MVPATSTDIDLPCEEIRIVSDVGDRYETLEEDGLTL